MDKNKKDRFKTPEGYFESFNERLFARIEAEEGEPKTDFLPKSDGFRVPQGYFDAVETQILSETTPPETKVVPLNPWRNYYAAAASIAALVALGIVFFGNSDLEPQFEDLASADIEAYFEDNNLGLTSYEIAEVMGMESVNLLGITEEDFPEEAIVDYLDNAIDEIEDLNLDYEEFD